MKNIIKPKGKNVNKKIQAKATGVNLTSQGGLVPIAKFLENKNLASLIQENIPMNRANNAVYQLHDIIEICVLGIISGARSLAGICDVWKDNALRTLLSWDTVPHRTVMGRLFNSLEMKDVAGMEGLVHSLRNKFWQKSFLPDRDSAEPIIIDVDSTVKTTYGNQQGAEKGFNSAKKGAKSFHPQLAFCNETKEILQGWYRCGSAYTANGIIEFMKQLLENLPSSVKYYFRGDSGYFSNELLTFLEESRLGYLIKVKLKNLPALLERQTWTAIANKPGWEETTFKHKCTSWDKERTFTAVRQEIKEKNPENILLEVKQYSYFCYVTTDSHLTAWNIHKKYGKRATCETWIEEAKNQVALANIKMDSFEGSSILFLCSVIAYNTFRYMGIASDNKTLQKWEPKTIRTYLIRTAGKVLTGGNQLKLITPISHFYQQEWNDWLKTGGLQKTG